MLVRADQTRSFEADDGRCDTEPAEETGPAANVPLCDEAEFDELLDELVADEAPRLFAVVQVYGERVDGRVAAWGMAFDDRAEVVSVVSRTYLILPSPERAMRRFARRPHITARLVWIRHDRSNSPDKIDFV